MATSENDNRLARLEIGRSIALRWILRDIAAKRLKLSPISDSDLQELRELGLIEVSDGDATLTEAGKEELR